MTPESARRRWAALLILGGLALLIRLVYLYELKDSPFFSVLIGDSLQFDTLARQISAGKWTGDAVFYQPQFYPYFLSAIYNVFGHDWIAARVLQSALGAASCMLLAVAGERFFDRASGLAAGSMLALYPPAIFFDGLIHKSSPDLFIMAVMLVALAACRDELPGRWLLAAGVALGALMWNRENARLLYPVVAVWLFSRSGVPLKRRGLSVALFTIGIAVVLVPVAIRNVRATGDFLLTTSQFGPNFYIGNHRGASGGYEPLVPGRGNALFEREDAIRIAEAATGRRLSVNEVSDYWRDRTLAEIRKAPGSWLRLMLRKVWLTFASGEPIDTESLAAYSSSSLVLRALRWFDFGIVLALALVGAWVSRKEWRRLVVLYAMFAVMAASVALFFVFARYRFPLVPLAMLFTGAGLMAIVRSGQLPSRQRLGAVAAAAVIAAMLHIPVETSADETYANYGSELIRQGRTADAVTLLRQAVRQDPSHVQPRLDLALALQKTGQSQAALEEFRAAARLDPSRAEAQLGLAISLQQSGQPREAIAAYEQVLRLEPDSIETMSNLAVALQEAGRPDDALAVLDRALLREPANVALRMNRGRLLMTVGRFADASASFSQAAAAAQRPADLLQAEYAAAEALARVGKIAEAIAHLERAHAAARAAGDAPALRSIEEALAMLRVR
jgi:tetratricopeptide (TPR) repeat protein